MARDSLLGQDFLGAFGQSVGQDLTREREERERRYERPSFADTLKAQAMSSVATAITAPIGQAIGGFVTEPFKRLEDNFMNKVEQRTYLKDMKEFTRLGGEELEKDKKFENERAVLGQTRDEYALHNFKNQLYANAEQDYGADWRTSKYAEKIEAAIQHTYDTGSQSVINDAKERKDFLDYYQKVTAGTRSMEEVKQRLRRYNPYPSNIGAAAFRSVLNFFGVGGNLTDDERERKAFKKAAPGWHDILFDEEGRKTLENKVAASRELYRSTMSTDQARAEMFEEVINLQKDEAFKNIVKEEFLQGEITETPNGARYVIENFEDIAQRIGLVVNDKGKVTVANPEVYAYLLNTMQNKSLAHINNETSEGDFSRNYKIYQNKKQFEELENELTSDDLEYLVYENPTYANLATSQKIKLIQDHLRTEETRNQNLVKLRIFKNKNFTSDDRKAAVSLKDNDILENTPDLTQAATDTVAISLGLNTGLTSPELLGEVDPSQQARTRDSIVTARNNILDTARTNLKAQADNLIYVMRTSENKDVQEYVDGDGEDMRKFYNHALNFLVQEKGLDLNSNKFVDDIFAEEGIDQEFLTFILGEGENLNTDLDTVSDTNNDPTVTAKELSPDVLSSNQARRQVQVRNSARDTVNSLSEDATTEEIKRIVTETFSSVNYHDNVPSNLLSPYIPYKTKEISGDVLTVEVTPTSIEIGRPHALYGGRNMATRGSTPEQVLEDISEDTLDGKLIKLHIEHAAGNYNRIYSELKNQGLSDGAILSSGYDSFKYSVSKENLALKNQLQAIRNSVDLNRIDITSHEFLLAVAPKEAEVSSEPTTNSMLAQTSAKRPVTTSSILAPQSTITDEEMDEIDAAIASQSSPNKLANFFISRSRNLPKPSKAELFVRFVNTDELSSEEYLRIAEEVGLDNRDVGGLLTILANNASV